MSSYYHKKTVEIFQTTGYMVKKSRKLKKEFGIIPEIPTTPKGKFLSNETKEYVKNFFQKDDISRVFPEKKDCLSVRNINTGEKELVQKRLVLMNLKECYVAYKEDRLPPKLDFHYLLV